MKYLRLILLLISIHLLAAQTYSQTVNFSVTINASTIPISPYIYGANPAFTAGENLGARRIGGNRLTGYNWENNASNAGMDYLNSSDNYLASGIPDPGTPGIVTTTFINEALNVGAYPLVTLQMAGYVAKDKNGTVSLAETAPSSRWDKVQFVKGSAFSLSPDIADTSVYMDEYVNYLVEAYGRANTETGVKGYELDNEPALWQSTHPRIHPNKPTCQEVTQKGIALSHAVKNVDSSAEIFGPVLYGFGAYYDFQSATDWNTVKSGKSYSWFIDYYLDEMKKAETAYGKRLLDVLDVHWYPEARGDNRISDASANSANDKAARLQAPRTLWDSRYKENSWIAQAYPGYLPLIPKLTASINKYYPGTKLAFTEFTYGGENDITGGIATSDALGIFGKYGVYFATFWPGNSTTSYVQSAYRIYRNYDGLKSTFGDLSMPSTTSDSVNTSIYSSIKTGTNEIHVIAVNKNLTGSTTAAFAIHHNKSVLSGNVWILDNSSTQIRNAGGIAVIQDNSFSYTLPAGSVCHIVLQTSPNVHVDQVNSNSPSLFKLGAYPNPFNISCRLEYILPDHSAQYRMDIIDIMGRVIRSYTQLSGNGSIAWNGTNENNQVVSSGVYCVIVRGDGRPAVSTRIVMIK